MIVVHCQVVWGIFWCFRLDRATWLSSSYCYNERYWNVIVCYVLFSPSV